MLPKLWVGLYLFHHILNGYALYNIWHEITGKYLANNSNNSIFIAVAQTTWTILK